MSIANAASQTLSGIMMSVLTMANVVTSTVNLAATASAAGNVKANAWLENVKVSTSLESKDDASRIFDEVADKIATRKLARKLAMQNAEYAQAYAEACALLTEAPVPAQPAP